MAQKVEVLLLDDLDGSQADETVSFGIDGGQYEIDLSAEHASDLRSSLEAFVAAARKTGGRRQSRGSGRKGRGPGEPSSHEVREWAKEQGIQVSERGRIPAEVYVRFQEAKAS
jgi:hypothetical protein